MTITLTEEQFRALAKLIFLGSWVANAFKDEQLPGTDDAEQVVLSRSPAFQSDDVVVYDVKLKKWRPARAFGEELNKIVDDYNIDAMYEELSHGLAHRDMIADLGEARVVGMTDEEFAEAEKPYIAKYDEEFDERGVDRVGIIT